MISTIKRIIWSVINYLVKKSSLNYIAGPMQEDAQKISKYLIERGYWVTQGYWDGVNDLPSYIYDNYMNALSELAGLNGRNYLSIKIPSLGFDVEKYHALSSKSRDLGVPIFFDSLQPEHATHTHSFIIDKTKKSLHDTGCTLPARWRRSIDDASLMKKLEVNVRVVKGQWEDPDKPIEDVNKNYLKIIDKLSGSTQLVRVATHDLTLAKEALKRLKDTGTQCELELLYGLPVAPLVTIANELNVPVRVYIAFGHAYLPYAIESFIARPEMIIPFLKELFKGNYLSSFPECKSNRLL